MDFPTFESRNEAKRIAAEKCFTIAKEKAKHGINDEAATFLRLALGLLDAMDGYDDQKGMGECPSFNGMNDIPFKSFKDLLLWKNIPISGQVKKFQSTTGKSSNSCPGEARNVESAAESNGTRNYEAQSIDRIVKYSYLNPRITCMDGLVASLFDPECNNETPNSRQPDSPSSEADDVDQTDRTNGKKLFTETINRAITSIKNAHCTFWLFILHAVHTFAKIALKSSAELAKRSYDNLKTVTVTIFMAVCSILRLALDFVFLIACVAKECIFAIGNLIFNIMLCALLYFFGRPTYKNSYIATKEVPKTAKEAILHLLSCENNDNHYKTLLVDETASQDEIRKNYKRFALLVHPDKCLSNDAEKATKILNAAQDVLGNPIERQEYDRQKVLPEESANYKPNFIQRFPCKKCGREHLIIKVERIPESGRYCGKCDNYHKANPGDVWIERSLWIKKLYLCVGNTYFRPEIYRFESWERCHSEQFDNYPANSHRVFAKLVQTGHRKRPSNFPNQPETDRRRKSGKKYRTRKYKR